MMRLGDLTVDPTTGRYEGPARGTLTPLELRLLRRLAQDRGRAVSREALLVDVWGYAETSRTRAVETTVARLRKRLEHDPRSPEFVLTVHGEGYLLGAPTQATAPLPPGREVEASRAMDWLAGASGRWMTLIGGGGIGKSTLLAHLAGRAAHRLGDRIPGGVRFVRWTGDSGALQQEVGDAARQPGTLSVIDLEDAPVDPGLVDILSASPARGLLAARRALDVRGEAILPLGPLSENATAEALGERAHLAEATCGLPLAIHLILRAATDPQRLDELTDDDAPARHRTLSANRASTRNALPSGCLDPGWSSCLERTDALARAGLVHWSADGTPELPAWLLEPAA